MKKDFIFKLVLLLIVITISALISSSCMASYASDETTLAENRALWASKKISNYRYTIQWMAFGPRDVAGKRVMIEVRNGQRVAVKCLNGELKNTEFFDKLDSAEDLFNRIQVTIASKPYKMSAGYAPTTGFPLYISAKKNDESVTDDWWRIEITDFEVID